MRDTKILRKNSNMVTRAIDGEVILMPVLRSSEEINCIYTLNKSASRVWDLIDGKKNLTQIKKKIIEEFDSDSKEVNKEMQKLLKDLKEIKAVV